MARKLRLVYEPQQALHGCARQDAGSGVWSLFFAFVVNLIIAWMLAGLLGHLGTGQVTLRNGVLSGAFVWFGFVLTTMAVNYAFSGRDRRLLLIDAGNWLIVLLVIGGVIGLFGL